MEKVALVEAVQKEEDKENVQAEKKFVDKLREQPKPDLDKLLTEEVDDEMLTPLTKINLKWRRKSAGLYAR